MTADNLQHFAAHFRPPHARQTAPLIRSPHPLDVRLQPRHWQDLQASFQAAIPNLLDTQLIVQTGANPSAPTLTGHHVESLAVLNKMEARAQLPRPTKLLFIEPQVTSSASNSEATTPTYDQVEEPSLINGRGTATNGRVGKIGLQEKSLPDVHAEASEYYGGNQVYSRSRTFSDAGGPGTNKSRPLQMGGETIMRNRRLSHGEQNVEQAVLTDADEITPSAPRRFLIDVEETIRIVLEQEDTDQK